MKLLQGQMDDVIEQVHSESLKQSQQHEQVLFRAFEEHLNSIYRDIDNQRQKVSLYLDIIPILLFSNLILMPYIG